MASGEQEPVFFWKPMEKDGFLGQWYPSPFVSTTADGTETRYVNTEQYMMHHKAVLMNEGDCSAVRRIMALLPSDSGKMRALGRKIPNFDEDIWIEHRYEVVLQANLMKFRQNPELRILLFNTGDRELVEASPSDRTWDIGFRKVDAEQHRSRWGVNLLGKVLMEVRSRLREEERKKGE